MSKTKTFICVIPFQPKGETPEKDGLRPVLYEAKGNSKLAYGKTRFPIVPVINGYTEKGDKIRVIAILTDGANYKYNYETYFVPEISELTRRNGYVFSQIETISTPDSEDIETQLELFADIIGIIGDNEEIYACITYGTKPTPIVQFIALNYAYKLKKNASIGCVAYGRFTHNDTNNNNGIYDQTALFYMDSIVNKLADMKAPHPETAIRAMLGLGDTDNDE
jgi:hypothetical protein